MVRGEPWTAALLPMAILAGVRVVRDRCRRPAVPVGDQLTPVRSGSMATAAMPAIDDQPPGDPVSGRSLPIRAPTYPPTTEPAASSTTAAQSRSATTRKITLATTLAASTPGS